SDGDIDLAVANINPNTVSVLLNRPTHDIELSATSYDFDEVKKDSSEIWSFKIYNLGVDSNLVIDIASSNPVFTPAPTTDTIPPDDSLSVTVTFTPDSVKDYTDSLTISSNDPDEPVVYCVLTGQGIEQDIALSDTIHDFGSVMVGDTAIWQYLVIKNAGTGVDLILDSLILNELEFFYTGAVFPDTIVPSDSILITVNFAPTDTGVHAGTIMVYSDDPDEGVVYCVLNGKGIQQDIVLSDTTYDFGDVAISDSSDWTFKIFNLGNAPLDVDSLKNSLTVYQVISPSFPQNIPPNDSVDVTLRFTPDTIKTYQDTLSIFSNDPDEGIVYVYLTGNGIDETPPAAPIGLTANGSNPSPWTRDSTFIINWTNPPDVSGIARALYKLGSAPTSNYDTTGSMSEAPPDTVFSTIEGSIPMYVWLEDGSGNVDYNNNSSVNLRYDITPPSTVIIISPSDGVYLNDSTVNFIWNEASDILSGVDHYVLQYALDNGFSQGLVETTMVDTSFIAVLPDTICYWHVKAVDAVNNEGSFSTTWQFEVDTQAPATPMLNTPVGGIWLNNTNVNFQWSTVTFTTGEGKAQPFGGGGPGGIRFSPVRYILEVDTNTSFTSPIVVDTLTVTSTNITLNEDFYYW
ncbi:choice-of-anchor D domain-containing protein, partial [candidate division WOR-3 bacterium]|nr:choice-of-anchor D domain-containing protein [candidate division WOR-3 bacterium]